MRSWHAGTVGRSALLMAVTSFLAAFIIVSPLTTVASAPGGAVPGSTAPGSAAAGPAARGPAAPAPATPGSAGAIQSPAEYLGFPIGTDRKLADYAQVRGYLESLAASSPWIKLWNIGQTTLGKPFIMAVMSTPENLGNLPHYIEISKRLADPRGLGPDEATRLAREGKALIMITCNLHSTEIGSAQMALQLAYEIASGKNPELARALEETVFFLVPSLNPDGLQMVVDWYKKWLGTEYEGCHMPWLYHYYAGHDDNRDWFMANLPETRAVLDAYYRTVVPQVVFDMHQMQETGARLFVPPYFPPANENVDPVIYREISLLGSYMQLSCEEAGLSGVISGAYFTAYWEGSSVMTPWWHNQVGLLSECASANVASPVFIEPGELRGDEPGFPRYEHGVNFPNPWPGGWWRLGDIVNYEITIARGFIESCALNRERILNDFYLMGSKAVRRGATEPPYAFVIPAPFQDPVTAAKLVDILMIGGVEVHRAKADFRVGERLFDAGSYVIRLDQPYRAYAKDLLEVQDYPDVRASKKEPFIEPYDVTGWSLAMQMGLPCETINERFDADLELIKESPYARGHFPAESAWGYALSPELNESCHAANIFMAKGLPVYRADEALPVEPAKSGAEGGAPGAPAPAAIPPGAFIIPAGKGVAELGREVATKLHVDFIPLASEPSVKRHALARRKVGLFKPWAAEEDEGWTRLLFDTFDVPYKSVSNADVKKGAIADYDVLVFPDIQPSIIKEGKPTGEYARFFRKLPPEYAGGIDKEGTENIKKFVKEGGTIICLGSSCGFAIDALELPVANVLDMVSHEEFSCPGSILKVSFKPDQPITYGMPADGFIYFTDSPAFATSVPYGTLDRSVLASYTEKDPRASGLLIGAERLYRRAALVEVKQGRGTIVLFGFAPQHRCQTLGTYKLLLNALLEGAPKGSTGALMGQPSRGATGKPKR